MPGVTAKSLHIDKVLTQMAMGYRSEGMIADMIFPIVIVDKQSDIYLEADRAGITRQKKTNRTPGTEARRVDDSFGSATYFARNYAIKRAITIEDKANTDPGMIFARAEAKAQLCIDDINLDYEIRVATLVTTAANVGSSASVSSAWSGAGDPIGDINTAIDNVRYANGVRPNRLTFSPEAWDSFRRDTTARNLINGTNNGGGFLNEDQVRNLFNVEQVLIGGMFQNTGAEGQSENLQAIWGDSVLVSYAPNAPTVERPSFGYAFRWQQANLPAPLVAERHPYDSRKKAEEVEVGMYQDEKLTGASYGFLITGVNSSQ